MSRRRWVVAGAGMLLGVVAMWPRPRWDVSVAANPPRRPPAERADFAPATSAEAPPPLERLEFDVFLGDDWESTVGYRFWGPCGFAHSLDVLHELDQDAEGLPRLIVHSPVRIPPPRAIRNTLSFVGLRPAAIGSWVADAWPQAAVAGVIAEERWASAEWSEAFRAATTRYVERYGEEPSRTSYQSAEARAFWEEIQPELGSQRVQGLATELLGSGDPWVEDVAQAYAMDEADYADRQRWALDTLAADPSPALATYAIHSLQLPSGDVVLSPDDNTTLRRVARERPEHTAGLAGFAALAALNQGQVDQAATWIPELERGLRIAQEDYWVESTRNRITQLRGQLAAHGRATAQTWQEGLIVVAHRCGEDEPASQEVTASGVYTDTWHWAWGTDTAFTDCIATSVAPGSKPPLGQRVALEIALHVPVPGPG